MNSYCVIGFRIVYSPGDHIVRRRKHPPSLSASLFDQLLYHVWVVYGELRLSRLNKIYSLTQQLSIRCSMSHK